MLTPRSPSAEMPGGILSVYREITLVLINSCEFDLVFSYGDEEILVKPDDDQKIRIVSNPAYRVKVRSAGSLQDHESAAFKYHIAGDIALECRCVKDVLYLSIRAGGTDLVLNKH